jgi:glycosyltransferase involved in cell wall biosynthesis
LGKKIAFALQKSEVVTAISGSVEGSIRDAGFASDRIRRIPNGVDVKRFSRRSSANVRAWLRVPQESRLIVSVGNYNPWKGQDILIRSMPRILAVEPWARLIIIGGQTEVLRSLIGELDLEDKVVLTGPISPHPSNLGVTGVSSEAQTDWLAEIYRSSETYVSAGIDEGAEGFSLAVLEGMAAGLPIVATNISGNRDIVRDGFNGYLVPPADHDRLADAVLRVINNDDSRALMGENAKGTANKYDWSEIAKQYTDVYFEAIERNKA